MAQFDFLIIFPLMFSLLLTLVLYYLTVIQIIAPSFSEVKKFRQKNLNSSLFYSFFQANIILKLQNSYRQITGL